MSHTYKLTDRVTKEKVRMSEYQQHGGQKISLDFKNIKTQVTGLRSHLALLSYCLFSILVYSFLKIIIDNLIGK